MDPWAEVRLRARPCHAEAVVEAGGDRSAAAIVAAAARLRDLEIVPFEPGTRFDHGILGVYERVGLLISVNASLKGGRREIVIAHEIGHHELDDDPVAKVTSVDAATGAAARIVGHTTTLNDTEPHPKTWSAARRSAREDVPTHPGLGSRRGPTRRHLPRREERIRQTAFLQALQRLNPARANLSISSARQYPAWLEKKHRRTADLEAFSFVEGTFELDPDEMTQLAARFGQGTLSAIGDSPTSRTSSRSTTASCSTTPPSRRS